MFKFIHAADFHLDSAFSSLPPQRAAARRRESRELPQRLADYAVTHGAALLLLSGDLFDGSDIYRETAESLRDALKNAQIPVFIAPGNHDWYGSGSPYATLDWPENVHIFHSGAVEGIPLPECTVYGAAFTAPEQTAGLLKNFTAPNDGKIHLMTLHGEYGVASSVYNPVSQAQVAASGLHYLALGHIHSRAEPFRVGRTVMAWPGCPEGRGFDERGKKGFYEGTVNDTGEVSLRFVPFGRHRYEILNVDITGTDPLTAVKASLPQNTERDLYRVVLTGEAGEQKISADALQKSLSDRFYSLEIRDETRVSEDVWTRVGEDSLRGLFLQKLRKKMDSAQTEEERKIITGAVRFGLAALEHRDLG